MTQEYQKKPQQNVRNSSSDSHSSLSMPKEMELGAPVLRTKDLKETLDFYENSLGLQRKGKCVDPDGLQVFELGVPVSIQPLLLLKHDPQAKPRPIDFAGLYHYAVLVPTRKSLAATYLAMGNAGVPFDGYADHTVSEALYLHDAEENGIEIYSDRPPETWTRFKFSPTGNRREDVQAFISLNRPLDFNSLLRELRTDERNHPNGFSDGARIGHVHLQVTNLERSVQFYHDTLGLDVTAHYPEIGAAFLSVGGYHHHVGLNTWNSLNGPRHQRGEAGLENFTMIVPDRQTLDALESRLPSSSVLEKREDTLLASDPDGIEISLRLKRRMNES